MAPHLGICDFTRQKHQQNLNVSQCKRTSHHIGSLGRILQYATMSICLYFFLSLPFLKFSYIQMGMNRAYSHAMSYVTNVYKTIFHWTKVNLMCKHIC